MARIRSIHPGLASDEAYMQMSMAAKAAWPLLWTECDDHGAFEWKPIVLKARIFPADNIDFGAILAELVDLGCVQRRDVGGKAFGYVRNFGRYQRPKHASYRFPFPEDVAVFAGFSASSDGACTEDGGSQGGGQGEPSRKVAADGVGVGEDKSRVGDASARDPTPEPEVPPVDPNEAKAFADAVRLALGDAPLSVNEWRRIDDRVAKWIANGWPQPVVLDVIRERCARSRDPPRTLGYLEQIIAGEIAARSRPLPTVVNLPGATSHVGPSAGSQTDRSAVAAARRLVDRLADLDRPADGGEPRPVAARQLSQG